MHFSASGRLLLDHSIVGQSQTSLTVRKDRNLAACRICGDIFQPRWFIEADDFQFASTPHKRYAGEREIIDWRRNHNRKHTTAQIQALAASGLSFTPEAANRLAPFGLAPITDAVFDEEVHQALMEAPRAPVDDVDTTLRGLVGGFYE